MWPRRGATGQCDRHMTCCMRGTCWGDGHWGSNGTLRPEERSGLHPEIRPLSLHRSCCDLFFRLWVSQRNKYTETIKRKQRHCSDCQCSCKRKEVQTGSKCCNRSASLKERWYNIQPNLRWSYSNPIKSSDQVPRFINMQLDQLVAFFYLLFGINNHLYIHLSVSFGCSPSLFSDLHCHLHSKFLWDGNQFNSPYDQKHIKSYWLIHGQLVAVGSL